MISRNNELCFYPLCSVAELVAAKEISPVELTFEMFERISALDSKLHSYLTIAPELAFASARRAEKEIVRGEYRGALHGVPIAVKDLIYTRTIRTTCGSKILADWIPDYDATVIRKLDAAGAVLLGKLHMTEFAGPGYHPSLPAVVHPWNPTRWPGASSSGCGVATAASLCFGSLASDTGGSIRHPAAACGVVGIRPTYGRVSRHGVFPLAESLDTVGVITRTVECAAAMLQVIAGSDPADPTSLSTPVPDYQGTLRAGVRGLRIGLDPDYCRVGIDPEVSNAVLAAAKVFAGVGAEVLEVKVPDVEEAVQAEHAIFFSEAAAAHAETYPSRADDYGPPFREILEAGRRVRGAECVAAQLAGRKKAREFQTLFEKIDVLLCPSMPRPVSLEEFPPYSPVMASDVVWAMHRVTAPYSLIGTPTISLPCGQSQDGLPLGLQLVGRWDGEAILLRAAFAYEQATEWHKLRPPV